MDQVTAQALTLYAKTAGTGRADALEVKQRTFVVPATMGISKVLS